MRKQAERGQAAGRQSRSKKGLIVMQVAGKRAGITTLDFDGAEDNLMSYALYITSLKSIMATYPLLMVILL